MKKEVHMKKIRRAILNPPAVPRRGCSAIFFRDGKQYPDGEVIFGIAAGFGESLARFSPPEDQGGTPSPGSVRWSAVAGCLLFAVGWTLCFPVALCK